MDIEFNKEYKRLRAVIRGNHDDNIKNYARLEMAKRWLLTCDMEYTINVYSSIGIPDMYIRKFDDIINFIYIYTNHIILRNLTSIVRILMMLDTNSDY